MHARVQVLNKYVHNDARTFQFTGKAAGPQFLRMDASWQYVGLFPTPRVPQRQAAVGRSAVVVYHHGFVFFVDVLHCLVNWLVHWLLNGAVNLLCGKCIVWN